MVLKAKKLVTSSQRHLVQLSRKNFEKKPLIKNLVKGVKNSNGRNNSGKITVRHKGGGHKQKFRVLDFLRINSVTGIICSIEYDPNRNANIASVFDTISQKFSYILAPKNIRIGDIVKSGPNAEIKIGHSLPISKIPVGSYIHCVSPKSKKRAQISRSAGTFSKLTEKTFNYAKIELSSGEQRFISVKCYASIGIVSNEFAFLNKIGKAGRSRWFNKRPTTRGVAMNPVDHPHGGGEGKKAKRGLTPWGKPTRGRTTTNTRNKLILNIKNE